MIQTLTMFCVNKLNKLQYILLVLRSNKYTYLLT